jgi:hypothetical protein
MVVKDLQFESSGTSDEKKEAVHQSQGLCAVASRGESEEKQSVEGMLQDGKELEPKGC